jgi:hypothetical protein
MILLAIALGIGAIAGLTAVVLAYWTKILQWAKDSLLPWVKENLPALAQVVEDALVNIDKAVVAIKRQVKEAWGRLRQTLLRQVATFKQMTNNEWLLEVISWVQVKLTEWDPAPVVKEVRSERTVRYDELPDEVREQLLRTGLGNYEADITKAQDDEVARMDLTA